MEKPRVLEIEILSELSTLASVREQFRQFAHREGWSESQIAEIVLAVDEALTNVIRHGYENRRDGKIFVRIETLNGANGDDGLEIRIRDFAKQVPLVKICGRDLADIRPGGLGVHLIRAMTNSAEYSHAEGGGMVLTMRKYKSHHAAADTC